MNYLECHRPLSCSFRWVLVFPFNLCCDWSSFGIANIQSLDDPRILGVVALFTVLALAFVAVVDEVWAPRECVKLIHARF